MIKKTKKKGGNGLRGLVSGALNLSRYEETVDHTLGNTRVDLIKLTSFPTSMSVPRKPSTGYIDKVPPDTYWVGVDGRIKNKDKKKLDPLNAAGG